MTCLMTMVSGIFFTSDVYAPTWEVSYVERGSGMEISSDIVLTFSKPIEQTDDTEIEDAEVATLFTLKIGGVDIAFTGVINANKDVVTLQNSSFIPALTTAANSSDQILVAPTAAVRGKVNEAGVSTTAPTDKYISDYDAPTVDVLTINTNTEGDEFKFNLSSSEDGDLYWLVKPGSETLEASVVKTTGALVSQDAGDTKVVTVDTDITSETAYTVYAVAEDGDGNISVVATLAVTTPDVTAPELASNDENFSTAGVLTLTFNDDVVPGAGPALAYVRLYDSKKIGWVLLN